ncbi:MAG: EamA/RhaT family transporter, partial [Candidatus Sericytochromatia bacterium]|nr:EamA/RhaT family transporter [Candidatus Tanganyikabacteria bacterium]
MSAGRATPLLWCLAAAALFGGSTPAAKAIIGEFGTLTLAGLLYLGAAAA